MAIAVGEGAVWVANAGDDSVSHVDPRANASLRSISVGDAPSAIAIGDGAVWVANAQDDTVSRIDPATNRVVATIEVGPTGPRASRSRVTRSGSASAAERLKRSTRW